VIVKGVPETIQSAHLLATRQAVELERREDTVVLTIPSAQRDPFDTVVMLR